MYTFLFSCPKTGTAVEGWTMLPFTLDHFVMQRCAACGGTHFVTPATGQKSSYPTEVGKNARHKGDEGEG